MTTKRPKPSRFRRAIRGAATRHARAVQRAAKAVAAAQQALGEVQTVAGELTAALRALDGPGARQHAGRASDERQARTSRLRRLVRRRGVSRRAGRAGPPATAASGGAEVQLPEGVGGIEVRPCVSCLENRKVGSVQPPPTRGLRRSGLSV